jgi:hypothetical protein
MDPVVPRDPENLRERARLVRKDRAEHGERLAVPPRLDVEAGGVEARRVRENLSGPPLAPAVLQEVRGGDVVRRVLVEARQIPGRGEEVEGTPAVGIPRPDPLRKGQEARAVRVVAGGLRRGEDVGQREPAAGEERLLADPALLCGPLAKEAQRLRDDASHGDREPVVPGGGGGGQEKDREQYGERDRAMTHDHLRGYRSEYAAARLPVPEPEPEQEPDRNPRNPNTNHLDASLFALSWRFCN